MNKLILLNTACAIVCLGTDPLFACNEYSYSSPSHENYIENPNKLLTDTLNTWRRFGYNIEALSPIQKEIEYMKEHIKQDPDNSDFIVLLEAYYNVAACISLVKTQGQKNLPSSFTSILELLKKNNKYLADYYDLLREEIEELVALPNASSIIPPPTAQREGSQTPEVIG